MANGRGIETYARQDTTVSLPQCDRDPPNLHSEISELKALRRRKKGKMPHVQRGRD